MAVKDHDFRQRPVTFVTARGQLEIRLSDNNTQAICNAAETLGALYFVTQDGHCVVENLPIWAIFELARCSRNGGGPRTWSLARPTRTFTAESDDGAVMYALMLAGRKS